MDITLSWKPQNTVWLGLIVSTLSVFIFVALAVRSLPDRTKTASEPRFRHTLNNRRGKNKLSTATIFTFFVFVFSLLNLPNSLLLSLLIAFLFFMTVRSRLPDYILLFSSFLFMSMSAILILIDQIRERYPRDFVWPLFFERFHILGVIAVLFITAAAIYELLNSRYEARVEE